jgi:hypothetical protein
MSTFETVLWYFLVGLDVVAITLFVSLLFKAIYEGIKERFIIK